MVAVVVAVVVVAAPVVALEELEQEHSVRQGWALLEEEEAVQRAPLALAQEGREQCPRRLPHSPPP